MSDEVWKDIRDYEGIYKISNKGKVKNRFDKILKAFDKHGKKKYDPRNDYKKIHLSKNNKIKTFSIHRLVAEAFIPNTKKLPQINHKNGIKNDNRVENLEWCTQRQNIQHYHKYLKKEKNNGSSK